MAKSRRVVFGRVNRRNQTVQMRPFPEDMLDLANSKKTSVTFKAQPGRPARTWHAADIQIVANGRFAIGVLGFAVSEEKRRFDEDGFSWIKGETEFSDAASEDTVVPFAIDMNEDSRYVALATSGRVKAYSAMVNLGKVLNKAAHDLGLVPAHWECDLVVSQSSIHTWLEQHPKVRQMRRTIKFTNPGRDLDDDRAEMTALHANRKTEEFTAWRNQQLDVHSPTFLEKLHGIETGDLEIYLEARLEGSDKAEFNSNEDADKVLIPDFGTDLERGMDSVQAALAGYVSRLSDEIGQKALWSE
jgi:hypothetical protein